MSGRRRTMCAPESPAIGIKERRDEGEQRVATGIVIAPASLSAPASGSAGAITDPTGTTRSRCTSERSSVVLLALSVLALHLATNGLYGYHRDELYYLDSARHLTWGFVDYPPITPAIARLSEVLFGNSVWGLRLWPSLAGSAMIILSAQIARELGGGRTARLLAAFSAAASPVLLGSNWLFETVTFDQLAWLVCFWLTARIVRTGDRRLWVALGACVGAGLETKYTILALVGGLIAAIALTPLRRHLRSPQPWVGLAVALLIVCPNVIWQAAHGWPSVDYTVSHHAAQAGDFGPLTFLTSQLALIGPLAIPVWLGGWYWLLSGRGRALGIAALVVFAVFLFAGKGYYIGPLHPLLMAAGMCGIEAWTRRRVSWLRSTAIIALLLQAAVLLPIAMPVIPEPLMARSVLPSIRTDFADTVGWPDLVAEIDAVYRQMPALARSPMILTGNYGEAGAVNTYGPSLGLPIAVSGELSYYYWRPARVSGSVIAVGLGAAFLSTLFDGCSTVGMVSNQFGLHNQESGAPIVVCARPRVTVDKLWTALKSFQ
ncbi:MAG: glycosyltransferase family 39 protein [Candidatus Dormiibacterota bacterium]